MIASLKKTIKNNPFLKLLFSPAQYLSNRLWSGPRYWRGRVLDVVNCPDTKLIPTVEDAGKVKGGVLIMHNGLKVMPLSYYGHLMLKVLKKNKGIHEPQEERIFLEVLKKMPKGALMLELGSYWAFYSMWFNSAVTDAKNFLVEPTNVGLEYGKKNFYMNKMKGDFTRAYIGESSGKAEDGIEIISVDDLINQKQIEFIDILHADIQEYEVEMLEGAKNALMNKRVGYVFISTHSNELHKQCVETLQFYEYTILQSIDLDETYSLDGLIVAVSPNYSFIVNITLSKKRK